MSTAPRDESGLCFLGLGEAEIEDMLAPITTMNFATVVFDMLSRDFDTFQGQVGDGAYNTVYHVEKDGNSFALRVPNEVSDDDGECFDTLVEAFLTSRFSFLGVAPHLMQLIRVMAGDMYSFVYVSKLASEGTLGDFLEGDRSRACAKLVWATLSIRSSARFSGCLKHVMPRALCRSMSPYRILSSTTSDRDAFDAFSSTLTQASSSSAVKILTSFRGRSSSYCSAPRGSALGNSTEPTSLGPSSSCVSFGLSVSAMHQMCLFSGSSTKLRTFLTTRARHCGTWPGTGVRQMPLIRRPPWLAWSTTYSKAPLPRSCGGGATTWWLGILLRALRV